MAVRTGKYTAVANGRFTGGYITRHYGQPSRGVYAVQLEQSQLTYMEESRPYAYVAEPADPSTAEVRAAFEKAQQWPEKTPVVPATQRTHGHADGICFNN